jgi:hypothetical protein
MLSILWLCLYRDQRTGRTLHLPTLLLVSDEREENHIDADNAVFDSIAELFHDLRSGGGQVPHRRGLLEFLEPPHDAGVAQF